MQFERVYTNWSTKNGHTNCCFDRVLSCFVVPARAWGLVRSIYLHVSGTLRESVVINLKSFGGI